MSKYVKLEGGQGGRKGHSNMTHSDGTEWIKSLCRKARRRQGKEEARAQEHERH